MLGCIGEEGGEEYDEETGLIYLRNRYYDPEIGRFISKDPSPGRLDRPSTLNPYCYVENNPVDLPENLEIVVGNEIYICKSIRSFFLELRSGTLIVCLEVPLIVSR
jgi:RHS repeat-associated protein